MARLESVAVGGYFPTPPRVVELIAGMLETQESLRYNIVDPAGASFVMLTPRWWVEAQTLGADDARASLFAAMLDRRTRCPLPADVAFYRQLLAAALDQGLAQTPRENVRSHLFAAEGLEHAGLDVNGAVAFSAKHDVLEAFLAEQCTEFFATETA